MIIAILAAFVTTLERVDTRTANNETPPGTTGLAKPHPPLDRAPGQPVLATERPHILPAGEPVKSPWGHPRSNNMTQHIPEQLSTRLITGVPS